MFVETMLPTRMHSIAKTNVTSNKMNKNKASSESECMHAEFDAREYMYAWVIPIDVGGVDESGVSAVAVARSSAANRPCARRKCVASALSIIRSLSSSSASGVRASSC